MKKKKKLLLVFLTTIILSLQIFYVISYAAAPSFYGHYWEVVFASSKAYTHSASELPYNKVWNELDFTSFYNKDVGSFIYTPEFTSNPGNTIAFSGDFDGEAANINNKYGDPVTNCILYRVPIALLTDTDFDFSATFRWFGSPATLIKYGSDYVGLLPFGGLNSYLDNAVVRIYAYDNIGNYTLIPSDKVFFHNYFDDYNVTDPLLNPKYYNDGSLTQTGSFLGSTSENMYYRDLEIRNFSTKNLAYLQIYFLSTSSEYSYHYPDGYDRYLFTFGDHNIPYFQRLGVISSNFAPDPPVPPTEGELIIESLGEVADIMQNNLDYLSIPNDISVGLVSSQKDRFDDVSDQLGELGSVIGTDEFQVGFDDVNHKDKFFDGSFNKQWADDSIGRFFKASVITKLFFLVVTFSYMSYVLFGRVR